MNKENAIQSVTLKPGDTPSLEVIYADVRNQFIPWVMDRYGLSQYYGEEILIESILAFRSYVDGGHVTELNIDPNFLIFSFGAVVGDAYVQHIGKVGLGPMTYQAHRATHADQQHGVQLVKLNYEYQPSFDRKTPLQKLADKAAEKLNPECQTIVKAFSRTDITLDQLAKVIGHGNAKGLKFMEDICFEKFSKLLDEEISNR